MQIELSGQLRHKIQVCSESWIAYFPNELCQLPSADARIDRILDAALDLLDLNQHRWVRGKRLNYRESFRYSPNAECPFRFELAVARKAYDQYVVMDVSEIYRQSSAGGGE